ncbi:MAG: bifunctional diaminohydroxyphosphoribosylaminopyrimidine deaminase/5-amino-6-(5-phosphoribosylamino)uracil reductase RibD [Polyangiales bacterium]
MPIPPAELDARAAARAAACARRGHPSPNPHVGAVVVRGGEVVGEGWHERVGGDHAEVTALREAGERARGATLYVTLEPCNHHGRTPPCTDAIARAGVARVVYAVRDPNPDVAGGGEDALVRAGVDVTVGFDEAAQRDVERLLRPWVCFVVQRRAHVTLKAGMTLDGRIATRTGESRWITGPEARRDVHARRAVADAVIVGSRTVLADDPELTARHEPVARQPVRVVVDSELRTPPGSKLARTAGEVPVWVFTREGHDRGLASALQALGVEVFASGAARVDLAGMLASLASRGVVSALCEGGGGLHGALLDAGLGDRALCYVAPMLLGGGGAPAFGGLGPASLASARRLRDVTVDRLGDDLRIEGEL